MRVRNPPIERIPVARRQPWQIPKLRRDSELGHERKVSWLELFFDLYFVVAVAQLSHQLSEHVSWSGYGTFTLQFIALFWVWVGITYYMERFETEGIEIRLIFLAYMVSVAGMAVFAHDGLHTNYRGYVLSYALGRLFTLALWVRAGWYNRAEFGPVARLYALGFGIGITSSIVSCFVAAPARLALLGVGLALDVLTPLSAHNYNKRLPEVSHSKFPERYGLFTLIVLGETVVGVVAGMAAHHHLSAQDAAGALLGILLGFSMWWIYFDFIARRHFKKGPQYLYGWVYLHIGLFVAIVGSGAGILNATEHSGPGLPTAARALVAGSVGLFLLCTGVLETLLRRSVHEPTHPRLSPALKIVAALLAPLAGLLPLGKMAFFCVFYPLLLIQMLYGLWVWYRHDLESPRTAQ